MRIQARLEPKCLHLALQSDNLCTKKMPRGKSAPKPPPGDDKKQAQSQDNTVNGEELTMTQLQNMINDLAAKMFEKKKKELKEEIEAEIEDDIQYRLLNQFEELEELIDNAKEEAEI